MKIGLHVIKRFAKAIDARKRGAADPLIARRHPGAEARHLAGEFCSRSMAPSGAEHLAKRSSCSARRSQGPSEGIKRSKLNILIQLFSIDRASAPTAGRTAVVRKSIGIYVLEIVTGWKIIAAPEDRNVAIVFMKGCNLQLGARAYLALRSQLLVEAALQNGTAVPIHQDRKRIHLVQRSRQSVYCLAVHCFQWFRSGWHGCKDQGRLPIVRNPGVDLHARTKRGCGVAKTNQNIFSPILKDGTGSKGHGTTLIDSNAAECRTHISELRFSQSKRSMRTRPERATGEPDGGDSTGGGISVIAHQPCKKKPGRLTEPLIIGKGGCRASGKIGDRTGPASAVHKFQAAAHRFYCNRIRVHGGGA